MTEIEKRELQVENDVRKIKDEELMRQKNDKVELRISEIHLLRKRKRDSGISNYNSTHIVEKDESESEIEKDDNKKIVI